MKKVKIRVVDVCFNKALANRYFTAGESIGPCPFHTVGQEYLYDGLAEKPEGICPWAWVDIYKSVSALSVGGSFSEWNNHPHQTIVCCTDGIRPVVYELTAMEPEEN